MTVDVDVLVKVLSLSVSIGAALFAWVQAKDKAGADALKALGISIASLETRVSKVEGEMQHMPDKDTVHKIELGMRDMKAEIAAQAETLRGYSDALKANTETMRRLEDFLMQARAGFVDMAPAAKRARPK